MSSAEHSECPPDRPRSVTFVTWGVFLLGTVNAWRASGFARQGDHLRALGIRPGPGWQMALALIWMASLLAGFVALTRRWPRIRLILPALLSLYGLYQLLLPLYFARTRLALQGLPAAALFYLLVVVYSAWALNRAAGKVYLGERDDSAP